MAVLPPVISPCVEPDPVLTGDSAASCPSDTEFMPCTSLVLSVGTIVATVPLSWILYNSSSTPDSYNLYRKRLGFESVFSLYQAGITDNTFEDTGIGTSETYDYYVRPVFGGIESIKSNIVRAPVLGLVHIYGYAAQNLYVINVGDVNSPFTEAVIPIAATGNGVGEIFADLQHIYLRAKHFGVSRLYILSRYPNQNAPAIITDFGITNPGDHMIVRTNKLLYNNLLFVSNPSLTGIQSWDISNPLAPVLISDVAHGYGIVNTAEFAFDESRGRIYFSGKGQGGPNTGYGYLNVSLTGVLSAGGNVILVAGQDRQFSGGFIFSDKYWLMDNVSGAFGAFALQPISATQLAWFGSTPTGFQIARVKGNYVFWKRSVVDAAEAGVQLIDISPLGNPMTPNIPVGPLGTLFNAFLMSGNYLYGIKSNGDLLIYNISNPLAPVLVSTTTSTALGIVLSDMIAGYPANFWDGANGISTE